LKHRDEETYLGLGLLLMTAGGPLRPKLVFHSKYFN